jgi:hypothetical protein
LYATESKREVTKMMKALGKTTQSSFLGWAFGADVMSGALELVAAIVVVVDVGRPPRKQAKEHAHELQLIK